MKKIPHTGANKRYAAIAILICTICFLSARFSFAQTRHGDFRRDSLDTSFIIVDHIVIEGNKRTRNQTILRELTFTSGDTLPADDLMNQLELSRNHVMNTGLFHEVIMNIEKWNHDTVDISVTVKERWYVLPLPAANLYDRSFNVWWVEHDHDLRWLQAGIRFYQKNLSGRNDQFQATALFGYQRRLEATYSLPYFDRVQKHGISVSASYVQSRSLTYRIDSNKELIYADVNSFQRSVFQTGVNLFFKPGLNYRYTLTAGYKNSEIADTIAALNPDYFLGGRTKQQFLYARVSFTRDFRDIVSYPLQGNFLDVSLSKLGFGIFGTVDLWEATTAFSQYVQLRPKWYLASINKVKVSFPTTQPYNLQRGLGYGNDYVAGYEYFAIDGQSWGFTKLDLKNRIVNFHLKSSPKNPFLKGARIPFVLYAKIYLDAGYVSNAHAFDYNTLDNQLLVGGGAGIDLVLLYDTTFRFEYSINKLGERGLFFHTSTYF
ncbi:MAG: BamA/TamA family outer membrane protein [Chitinophagales bacterium]